MSILLHIYFVSAAMKYQSISSGLGNYISLLQCCVFIAWKSPHRYQSDTSRFAVLSCAPSAVVSSE